MSLNALLPSIVATLSASALSAPALPPATVLPQQDGPPIGMIATDATPILSLRTGNLARVVKNPKDDGLVRALGMLQARLADLPTELDGELPAELEMLLSPDVMPVWMHVLQAQKSFSIGLSGAQSQSTGNPLVGSLSVEHASEEEAANWAAQLDALLQRMQAPVPPGLYSVKGSSVVTHAGMEAPGTFANRARVFAGPGELMAEMSIDVAAGIRFAEEMAAAEGAGPEAAMVFDLLGRMGLDQLQLEIAQTVDAERTRSASVMTGVGARLSEAGILPEGGITAAHLAPIPADATMAYAGRMDFGAALEALNGLAMDIMAEQGMGGSDPIDQLMMATGIDLRDGLFNALGDTVGYYSSMTTGGGGMTSTVMFASVSDAEALLETRDQLSGMMNALASGMTRGYVSMRPWMDGDIEYMSLSFPGLPVPIEPTFGLGEEWLVLAATPQAALAAMQQVTVGESSLASKGEIAVLADGTKTAVSYVDTAYFTRLGYGATTLAGSAIANAMRSPMDGTRDAGKVVPLFNEFQNGIVPAIGYTEIVDGDLVTRTEGDSSVLVQVAMVAGILQEYMMGAMVPVMAIAGFEEYQSSMRYR